MDRLLMRSIYFILFFFIALGESAFASGNPCRSFALQDPTLEQIVSDANFIALYSVESVERDLESSFHQFDSYTYSLRRRVSLKGEAPLVTEIQGLEPEHVIPQVYFSLDQRHSDMVNLSPERRALGVRVLTRDKSDCVAASRFFIGYQYLIFGGVTSTAAFEPVHALAYDPWYQAVKAAVRASEQ